MKTNKEVWCLKLVHSYPSSQINQSLIFGNLITLVSLSSLKLNSHFDRSSKFDPLIDSIHKHLDAYNSLPFSSILHQVTGPSLTPTKTDLKINWSITGQCFLVL